MIYLPTGSSDLILILCCMTSNLLVLDLFLYSSSLCRTDTTLFSKVINRRARQRKGSKVGEVYIAQSMSYHLLNSFSQFDNSDTGITIRADLINPASNMPARNDMTWTVFPNLQTMLGRCTVRVWFIAWENSWHFVMCCQEPMTWRVHLQYSAFATVFSQIKLFLASFWSTLSVKTEVLFCMLAHPQCDNFRPIT